MIAQEIGCRDAIIFTVDSDIAILDRNFVQMLEIGLLVQIGSGNSYRVIHVNDHTWSDSIIQSLPYYMPFLGVMLLVRFMALEKPLGYQRFRRKRNIWML